MRHVIAFLIKFLSTLVVLGIILGVVFDYSVGDVVYISFGLSAIGYLLGDLYILRRTSNTIATIADSVLAFLVIMYISSIVTNEAYLVTASLLGASFITILEFYYHRIVPRRENERQATNTNENRRVNNAKFQTEASEDLAIARPDVRNAKEENNHDPNTNKV
ncbi:YndM family protein [Bacillus sp. V5-8f]|uniref:YndM family protein n=1 Tax=Bacillus sp. V5-8f TaxID=2053044 RepID=UPI0015E10F3D|nr:YndM family protein [Bacillus sp. V5-8f]